MPLDTSGQGNYLQALYKEKFFPNFSAEVQDRFRRRFGTTMSRPGVMIQPPIQPKKLAKAERPRLQDLPLVVIQSV